MLVIFVVFVGVLVIFWLVIECYLVVVLFSVSIYVSYFGVML